MKKVALIHTVPSVYAEFPGRVLEAVGKVQLTNTLDEFLSSDANEKGVFTRENLNRFYMFLRSAEMTGADAILVTCSTLTPHVERLRPLIGTRIVSIDGAMIRKVVAAGDRITVFATARSAARAAQEGISLEAALNGRTPRVEVVVCDPAFTAIKKLDKAEHDRLVMEAAGKIKGSDVIMIAQASMAHLEDDIRAATGIPTFSGPKLCLEELKEVLGR